MRAWQGLYLDLYRPKKQKAPAYSQHKAAKPVLWGGVKSSVWRGTRRPCSSLSAVL